LFFLNTERHGYTEGHGHGGTEGHAYTEGHRGGIWNHKWARMKKENEFLTKAKRGGRLEEEDCCHLISRIWGIRGMGEGP
jgi:hypothetical protein